MKILLAPPGSGKTGRVLKELRLLRRQPGWPCAWVLLPDGIRQAAFRQRLFDGDSDIGRVSNIRLLLFDDLVALLPGMAGMPSQRLRPEEREQLLREVIGGLAQNNELELFAAATELPGLLRSIGGFLDELRHQMLSPDAFADAAPDRRDQELARIALRYQAALQALPRQDRAGRLRQARQALDDRSVQHELARVDFLIVDGHDHFSPLQASLLMKVAACTKRALVTLPWLDAREESAGARFQGTLSLLQWHSPRPLQIETLPARPGATQQVAAQLFMPAFAPQRPGKSLTLLEAPGPAQEAREITRRIRQLLLETDSGPEDCLIVLYDWQRYAAHFGSAGREHDLPLALARGQTLSDMPAMHYLQRLLKLADDDFPLQDLLDVLRAPCFRVPDMDEGRVAALEAIGRRRRIVGGRSATLAAVSDSGEADAGSLAQALATFMDAVTPPAPMDGGSPWTWLRRLCGLDGAAGRQDYSLDMPGCLSEEAPAWLRARESTTIAALDGLLKRQAGDNVRPTMRHDEAGAGAFRLAFGTALEAECLEGELPGPGKVFVVEAAKAAGLSSRHVFIPGLSADSFPRGRRADPLHLDSERQDLASRGADLGPVWPGADDALFVQLVFLARVSLMLTRPVVDKGKPKEASHLWQEMLRVCPEIKAERVRASDVTPVARVASLEEALVTEAGSRDAGSVVPLRLWLQREHGGLLERVEHARQVEAHRLSRWHDHDRFSGVLSEPDTKARVAAMLGPDKLWSATQLEQLGTRCFRFFAARLLYLEKLWEPEPSLNAMEAGTLNHEILERVYRSVEQRGLTITPANLEEALDILDGQAQAVLDDASRILERETDDLWPWEQRGLLARLQAFVRLDFSAQGPLGTRLRGDDRRVRWQELRFGYGDVNFGIPLTVYGKDEDLRMRGVIDRIDVAGSQALVADYKSGSTAIRRKDIQSGVNVQMPLYLQAARQLLQEQAPGLKLSGGLYLHLRGTTRSSGFLQTGEKGDELVATAIASVAENIAAARSGDFGVKPRLPADNGLCVRYCEFSELCRVRVTRSPAGDIAE